MLQIRVRFFVLRKFTLRRAPVTLAAMALLLLFAAFMQLYLLNSYPPGSDPDAAAYGLNALKPLRLVLTSTVFSRTQS